MSQFQQSHIEGAFIMELILQAPAIVKPLNKQNRLVLQLNCCAPPDLGHRKHALRHAYCIRDALSCKLDTALNTVSMGADRSMLSPQLRRVWVRDGYLSNYVLVSIVRLTVESNLVTSKNLRGFYVIMRCPRLTLVQPLSVWYH